MIMMANDVRGLMGPKFSWHVSYNWGKPRKKLNQENWTDRGLNPGQLGERQRCYPSTTAAICFFPRGTHSGSPELFYFFLFVFIFVIFCIYCLFSFSYYTLYTDKKMKTNIHARSEIRNRKPSDQASGDKSCLYSLSHPDREFKSRNWLIWPFFF